MKKPFRVLLVMLVTACTVGCAGQAGAEVLKTEVTGKAGTAAASDQTAAGADKTEAASTGTAGMTAEGTVTAGRTETVSAGKGTAASGTEAARLKVTGTDLTDRNGSPVILRGMSTHGMQWFPQFAGKGAVTALKQRGANLLRLAMYTEEGGYLSDRSVKDKVYAAAELAASEQLYVILDWHILSDGNPQTHQAEAVDFFREASARFADNPYVLYEICNEPNGGADWNANIRPYAEAVIPAIRESSPNAVVIVGTPTWSQDVDLASANPLPFSNVMLACHFYAGTHGQFLRDKIDKARANGSAVFVSEWGTSAADGNGGVFLDAAREWMDFLKQRKISWANWSLCDKAESSAALLPGADPNGNWSDAGLSESGKFVFSQFAQ